MIDFLKLSTNDINLINYFKTHVLLEWVSNESKFNRYDPEVVNTKDKYQYKGIVFCFYPNQLKISFLPHYYFNENLHNANDFSVIDCINVILDFQKIFEIDLKNLKVINLEFGINVISPIDIKDLIMFLAYHGQNEFRTDREFPYSKKGYRINERTNKPNDYKIIKAYAKGLQFPEFADINTFRFEVKSEQSKYINKLGIFTLNDLLSVEIYFKLIEVLLSEFGEILILNDGEDFSNLNSKEKSKIKPFLNPNYWYRIKQENVRNKFNKEKIKYYKLLDKIESHLKRKLEKIVFDKLELLKRGAFSTPQNKDKNSAFSTLYNIGNCTCLETAPVIKTKIKNIVCKVTGLNIEMQKRDSVLLSHTGLKYYYETDKKIFEQLKRSYLSKIWVNAGFEIQIKEMAHNIRNANSNQKIKQNKIYKVDQLNLLFSFKI